MKTALKGKSEAEKEVFFQQRYQEYQRLYGTDTNNQVIRYLRWVGLYPNYYGKYNGLLQGNFGYSYELKDEVLNVIKEPMKNTIFINIFATALALGITIPLGITLAVKKGSRLDQTVQVLTLLGYSLPAFLICIVFIWIFCALLYVCQVSPVAFRLGNMMAGKPVYEIWVWIGAAVMIAGVLLEAGADAQKNAAKKANPKRFVDTGLYRIVRCPNYLGELVIWTGCLLSGIGACMSIWQWIIALIGYTGIVYVMFSGARRLEIRQNRTYGDDPVYQEYVRTVPILIPFIPIYSVEKHKWLVA